MEYKIPVGATVITNKNTYGHYFGKNKEVIIISEPYFDSDGYMCRGKSMYGDYDINQHLFRDQFYYKDPIQ